jgi:hypothetical protein
MLRRITLAVSRPVLCYSACAENKKSIISVVVVDVRGIGAPLSMRRRVDPIRPIGRAVVCKYEDSLGEM